MVTSEYWPLDVFRPGILPNMYILVRIENSMFDLLYNNEFPVASRWHYIDN